MNNTVTAGRFGLESQMFWQYNQTFIEVGDACIQRSDKKQTVGKGCSRYSMSCYPDQGKYVR